MQPGAEGADVGPAAQMRRYQQPVGIFAGHALGDGTHQGFLSQIVMGEHGVGDGHAEAFARGFEDQRLAEPRAGGGVDAIDADGLEEGWPAGPAPAFREPFMVQEGSFRQAEVFGDIFVAYGKELHVGQLLGVRIVVEPPPLDRQRGVGRRLRGEDVVDDDVGAGRHIATEAPQARHQPRRREDRRDADDDGFAARAAQSLDRLLNLHESGSQFLLQVLADAGEAHAAPALPEERLAEIALQRPYLAGDRAGSDEQRVRGGRHRAEPGDGHEGVHGVERGQAHQRSILEFLATVVFVEIGRPSFRIPVYPLTSSY